MFFVLSAPLHQGATNQRRLLRCVWIIPSFPCLQAILFIICVNFLTLFLQEGLVLISGLPESGWSEADIVTLVEPFGMASDIIMAGQLGKVKLSGNG